MYQLSIWMGTIIFCPSADPAERVFQVCGWVLAVLVHFLRCTDRQTDRQTACFTLSSWCPYMLGLTGNNNCWLSTVTVMAVSYHVSQFLPKAFSTNAVQEKVDGVVSPLQKTANSTNQSIVGHLHTR